MNRFEVRRQRVWQNSKTGAIASIYGAAPYYSAAAAVDWSIVETEKMIVCDRHKNITFNLNEAGMVRMHGENWREVEMPATGCAG